MENQDQKKPEPKIDPSYTDYEQQKKDSLLSRGIQWYSEALKPVSDFLYNLFTPGPEEQISPPSTEDKPTTIQQAVDRYYSLPRTKKK